MALTNKPQSPSKQTAVAILDTPRQSTHRVRRAKKVSITKNCDSCDCVKRNVLPETLSES